MYRYVKIKLIFVKKKKKKKRKKGVTRQIFCHKLFRKKLPTLLGEIFVTLRKITRNSNVTQVLLLPYCYCRTVSVIRLIPSDLKNSEPRCSNSLKHNTFNSQSLFNLSRIALIY